MQDIVSLIFAVIAIVGVFANLIAFLVARVELIAQRKETKELAKLTSELEHKVHKLATSLSYKIKRLERVRELVTEFMRSIIVLSQTKISEKSDKLMAVTTIYGTGPELMALAHAIGDNELREICLNLANVIDDPKWVIIWNDTAGNEVAKAKELVDQIAGMIAGIQYRTLQILEETTNISA